jgi:hypothetical protein
MEIPDVEPDISLFRGFEEIWMTRGLTLEMFVARGGGICCLDTEDEQKGTEPTALPAATLLRLLLLLRVVLFGDVSGFIFQYLISIRIFQYFTIR